MRPMPTLESDKGWKEELGRLLDEPNSSKRAKAFAVTMGGLVVLSVLLLVIQTMPRYRDTFICEPAIEFVFNSIFSLELIARLVASGGRVDVMWRPIASRVVYVLLRRRCGRERCV